MRSKRALFNISTRIVLQAVLIVYTILCSKIIISTFGSEVNGLVSSITKFLAYISIFESGFGGVVQYLLYKPLAKKDYNSIAVILKSARSFFRKICVIFVIYIVVLLLFYNKIIDSNFDYLYTCSMIVIISISTFSEYFFGAIYRVFLLADQKKYVISIIQIITYIINIILVIVLAKFFPNIHVIKLITGLVFLARPIIQNIYVNKNYQIIIDKNVSEIDIPQKWDAFAQHVASIVHANTDVTVISVFCKLTEVSVYSVYYMIVSGITSISSSILDGFDSFFGDMLVKKEKENLLEKFNLTEVLFYTINTILYSSTAILIIPFIKIYTIGITDVNYIRNLFGFLLIIAEMIYSFRFPYSNLVKSAGMYKETKNGAIVEAFINIIVSVILVIKFGIIGVAIGTICAMTFRTFELLYFTNKKILERNYWISINKIILSFVEFSTIIAISYIIPSFNSVNYLNWILNGIIVISYSSIIVLAINILVFKKDFYLFKKMINKMFGRRERSE